MRKLFEDGGVSLRSWSPSVARVQVESDAAGYVVLELGSDINGSIRQPAHCCGVFGHKPSTGLVPLHGHAPPRSSATAADGTVGLGVVGHWRAPLTILRWHSV